MYLDAFAAVENPHQKIKKKYLILIMLSKKREGYVLCCYNTSVVFGLSLPLPEGN